MSGELRFDGQVALITGGASGLGLSYAKLLAKRGAKVVVNGNHRPSGEGPEQAVAAKICADGGEAISVNGSVRDEAAIERMVSTAIEAFGRLDILVNNAGTCVTTLPIQEAPDERFVDQFEMHVTAALKLTRAAWKHLVASGNGRIVNTGSPGGYGAAVTHEGKEVWDAGYSIAKGSLFTITRQMGGAGAAHGIKANLIIPWGHSAMTDRTLGDSPLGRYFAERLSPKRVAAVVAYLVHRDCPVSGQFFAAGGGRIARVFIGSVRGYYNSELAPEDVRANWDQIFGHVGADGYVSEAYDIFNASAEFVEMQRLVGGGTGYNP